MLGIWTNPGVPDFIHLGFSVHVCEKDLGRQQSGLVAAQGNQALLNDLQRFARLVLQVEAGISGAANRPDQAVESYGLTASVCRSG